MCIGLFCLNHRCQISPCPTTSHCLEFQIPGPLSQSLTIDLEKQHQNQSESTDASLNTKTGLCPFARGPGHLFIGDDEATHCSANIEPSSAFARGFWVRIQAVGIYTHDRDHGADVEQEPAGCHDEVVESILESISDEHQT